MAAIVTRTEELVAEAMKLGAVQIPWELQQLADFLEALAPQHVMEIGSESGGTFYVWCQLASGMKISVDWPEGKTGSGKYKNDELLARRTQMMKSWGDDVHIITGNSQSAEVYREVRDLLDVKFLDFLFIDGDHTYQGAAQDYRVYRRFVKPGGYIAFHDIKDNEYHRLHGCEVGQLWVQLEGEKTEFISPSADWGGIGLLRV